MKKVIIKPRQSGKTTNLLADFAKDCNGIFVATNANQRDKIITAFNATAAQPRSNLRRTVICPQQLLRDAYIGRTGATLYIDEYFMLDLDVKKVLFNTFILKPFEFVASGTPKVQFKRTDIADVATWWVLSKARTAKNILLPEKEMISRYGEELMFNLIVAPEVEIITPQQDERRKMMPKEVYEMEVLGNIFKGE